MPRANGSRTGQKHKKRKLVAKAEEAPPERAVEAAIATAEEPQGASPSEDVEFRSYQILSRLVDDMITQLEHDQDQIERERVWHEMHIANAIACAEAYKRRFAASTADNKWLVLAPFREAWRQALHEWRTAYKNDVCSECSQEIQPEWHISDCLCVIDCRKCGQRIPARPWRVSIGGTIRPCRCEKIAIIAGGLFGPGLESDSNLGRF